MSDRHKSALQSSIQYFSGMEETVEEALIANERPSSVAKLNNVVSRQIDGLQEILTEVKNQIGA